MRKKFVGNLDHSIVLYYSGCVLQGIDSLPFCSWCDILRFTFKADKIKFQKKLVECARCGP